MFFVSDKVIRLSKFSSKATVKLFFLSSFGYKGRILLSKAANSFPKEKGLLRRALVCKKANRVSLKLPPLYKVAFGVCGWVGGGVGRWGWLSFLFGGKYGSMKAGSKLYNIIS